MFFLTCKKLIFFMFNNLYLESRKKLIIVFAASMSLTNQSAQPHFLPMSLCSIDRPFVRAICIFRSHKFHETFCRVIEACVPFVERLATDREAEKKKRPVGDAMKANGRRDEENDAAVSLVQYVGQTTIIVRRFLVYYTISN